MAPGRGAFIVFEGLDRSGKTTQSTRLAAWLRTVPGPNTPKSPRAVEHLRFPDRSTAIGASLGAYLGGAIEQDDRAVHLLFSANRWERAAELERLLAAGTTCVVDRYYYSGCVYSAAKGVAGMDLEWCRGPEVGLPRPDVCLFFDLAPEEVLRRGGFGEERYERREMQARVRGLYEEMRGHGDEGEDMVIVDAGRSMEEVEAQVQGIVEGVLRRLEERPYELRRIRPW